MECSEFKNIFHYGRTATYEESCYFLPLALQYLFHNPYDGYQCSSEIIWFISEYKERLEIDFILNNCIKALKSCLANWTNKFEIEHFDRQACMEKGWGLDHYDIVINSQTVSHCLDDLVVNKSLGIVAFDFASELHQCETLLKAAWFLELSRSEKEYESFTTDSRLKEMFSDRESLCRCAKSLTGSSLLVTCTSPTYWNDVFARLSLINC